MCRECDVNATYFYLGFPMCILCWQEQMIQGVNFMGADIVESEKEKLRKSYPEYNQ